MRGAAVMIVTGMAAGVAFAFAGPALAADDASDQSTATVVVASEITLTGLTPALGLAGMPGQIRETTIPIAMTVTTNNGAGYSVTVAAAAAALVADTPGNPDTIPVDALAVRETGTTPYTSLVFGTPTEVFHKTTMSSPSGDLVSNDYRITVPDVRPDAYRGVLTYVATTL